ncbi:MAG: DUF2283 domain-containing protein [Candidatus Diapherotrites archaeon]|nr:DUF2283 domain-containing protein [Candidatus Diapherotrites archaeon]
MRIHYDKKADALYIRFSEARYFESEELRPDLIVDLNARGRIIGFEILTASKSLPREAFKAFGQTLLA